MRLKRKWLVGEVVSAAPEYEDVAAAREAGVGWSCSAVVAASTSAHLDTQ